MAVAKEGGNSGDELYPKLLASRVAAKRGQQGEAEKQLHEIEQDEKAPRFLRWEAQHALGQLYESEQRPDDARQEYEASLSAFESARAYVRHEDFQVSFLTNARRIYDDFIHFLIAQGQTADALRWADFNRARTLADALGLLAKSAVGKSETGPPQLAAQTIAREAKGIILFYWLSDQSSYLWAITPSTTRLFPLPARSLIEAASQRYRRTLIGPQDVLRFGDSDGEWLYQTLIGPSQALLASEQNVY